MPISWGWCRPRVKLTKSPKDPEHQTKILWLHIARCHQGRYSSKSRAVRYPLATSKARNPSTESLAVPIKRKIAISPAPSVESLASKTLSRFNFLPGSHILWSKRTKTGGKMWILGRSIGARLKRLWCLLFPKKRLFLIQAADQMRNPTTIGPRLWSIVRSISQTRMTPEVAVFRIPGNPWMNKITTT